MTDPGQLYVHDFPAPPGERRYTLAVTCADGCASVVYLHTHSPQTARDRLWASGWLHVRGRGWVCGECAAQARERALMGETAHV